MEEQLLYGNLSRKILFADGELDGASVIRKFRITAADGKVYNTNHYNLKAIIAVGNMTDEVIPKEESENGTDFSEDNYIEQTSEFFA